MKNATLTIICTIIILLACTNTYCQSIGYSFSYTFPFSKESNDFNLSEYSKYSKYSEYSVGLVFNNKSTILSSTQIRLSRYKSFLKTSLGGGIVGFSSFEANSTNYYLELEGYIFNLKLKNGINFGFGTKFSYLLKSNVKGFTTSSGITSPNGILTKINSTNFEGQTRFKNDLLLRLNWKRINLTKNIQIEPSYIFGYTPHGDFKDRRRDSSYLSHRIEFTILRLFDSKR